MALALGILLLFVALGLGGGAIWLALPLRRRVDRLADDVNSLQGALEQLRAELSDLRAAAQVVPVPPLPRSRPAGLEDLRERLRAAHSESDEPAEE